MNLLIIVSIISILGFGFVFRDKFFRKKWILPTEEIPSEWRKIISEKVAFYRTLDAEEKKRFEYKVQNFILNYKITAIDVDVDLSDKLLVASSAVIPIFAFDDWQYLNLQEVLIYPATFNTSFETAGADRSIMGMVGGAYLEGKMIISISALRQGFSNETDKKNTAIHEFVHLIDKLDGSTDGIPRILLEKQYVIPWIDLINKEYEKLFDKRSDINPYAGTNKGEFFAVISEYFFERPELFDKNHPELFALMEQIFKSPAVKKSR
jgi:Mlc titration factor MtfA (ptsG expression regulator)